MSMFQSDMNNEFKRYATFNGFRNPDGVSVWPTVLARSGFYRSGDCGEFEVVCFACGLKVNLGTVSRDPVTEVHRRLSPGCSFVVGSSNNQPVPPVDPTAALEWLSQNFSLDTLREADMADQQGIISNLPGSSGSESVINLPESFLVSNIVSQHPSLSDLSTLELEESRGGGLPSLPMDFLDGFANATLDSGPITQLLDAPSQRQFGSGLGGPGEMLVTDGVGMAMEGEYPNNGMADAQVDSFSNRQQPQQQQQPQRQPHRQPQQQDEESLEVEAATQMHQNKLTFGDLGIITERPKRPDYATVQSRLSTFWRGVDWSGPRISQSVDKIAEAGFYYAGYADCCRCFYCGGGLKSWEKDDDPWVEHARWFQKCPFILANKGQEFVQAVESLARTCNAASVIRMCDVKCEIQHIKSTNQRASDDVEILATDEVEMEAQNADELQEENVEIAATEAERLMDENLSLRQPDLCKICYEVEVGIVYVPCGHLVTCGTCAPTVKLCPLCRQVVGGQIRIQRDD